MGRLPARALRVSHIRHRGVTSRGSKDAPLDLGEVDVAQCKAGERLEQDARPLGEGEHDGGLVHDAICAHGRHLQRVSRQCNEAPVRRWGVGRSALRLWL